MNHEYQKINKLIIKKRKLENEKSHTLLCIACRINVGKKKKQGQKDRDIFPSYTTHFNLNIFHGQLRSSLQWVVNVISKR